ncbi:hypothetical protein C2G38_2167725 [Gigaspora rosea]|uniref:Uncharacterized protein n=1 Tax=Gigaspora rosea TaxID=44941 RepID=A0A397VQF7_9GLOM|nr:hypothetical protein C2G38_2167725 [Gigaspora rosea]
MKKITKKTDLFHKNLHLYLNFNTYYYFDRKKFDELIKNFFDNQETCPFRHFVYQYEKNYNAKDQDRDCHIQGFFILKKQMRIGNYKLAVNDQKEKITGIKGILQIDKIHFNSVASDKDSILYCKKKHNKCSIHNRMIVKEENYSHLTKREFNDNTFSDLNKNRLAICQCSYDDLNNFSNCSSDEIIVNGCPEEIEYNPFFIERIENDGVSLKKEDIVIFNEFDALFFRWQKLLDLLDRGVHSVQIKGSHINYSPKVQAFTSNIPLDELYYCAEDYPTIKLTNGESIIINYEEFTQQDQDPKTESNQKNSKQYHMQIESDNKFETEFDPDPQIESSTKQHNYQYSEDSSNIDISEPESELHSDDSDYTQIRRKANLKK